MEAIKINAKIRKIKVLIYNHGRFIKDKYDYKYAIQEGIRPYSDCR